MSWWDCMKLRRRADHLRACGWVNLALTLILCAVGGLDGLANYMAGAIWAGFVMAVAYGAASLVDRRADRVVGR
jgi:hypothetical protein